MKIVREYHPYEDKHRIVVEFYGLDLVDCNNLPFKHLVTEEQALGIIEDAVLMSMGLQRNQPKKGGK